MALKLSGEHYGIAGAARPHYENRLQLSVGVMPQRTSPTHMRHDLDLERAVLGRERFDAVFGGWSSFHDGLLLALRLEARGGGRGARAEADFELAEYTEQPNGNYRATAIHRVTLAFHDVSEVGLDGFLEQNIVGELRLERSSSADASRWPIRVILEGIPGYGGDLTWTCSAVEVVRITGPFPPAA